MRVTNCTDGDESRRRESGGRVDEAVGVCWKHRGRFQEGNVNGVRIDGEDKRRSEGVEEEGGRATTG